MNIRVDANWVAFGPLVDMGADMMTKVVKRELFMPLRDRMMGWHLIVNQKSCRIRWRVEK
jgi:hypothetical protein